MTITEAAQAAQNTIDQLTERVSTMAAEHAETISVKDAQADALRQAFTELDAYKTEMISQVTAVLQSGDPAQYEALATAFLTPKQELERQEKLARIAEIEAEKAELEAELA